MKEDRRGYSSVDSYDDGNGNGNGGDANNNNNNNKRNADAGGITTSTSTSTTATTNYTDYISSRHSSSFDAIIAIDDNSATLPRSNIHHQKHGGNTLMMLHDPSSSLLSSKNTNNNTSSSKHANSSPGGAVVELSSLFRPETDDRGNTNTRNSNTLANNNNNHPFNNYTYSTTATATNNTTTNNSNNENENGEDGDDEMNGNNNHHNHHHHQQQRRRRRKKNNLVDKGSISINMNMNSSMDSNSNSVTSAAAAAKKININRNANANDHSNTTANANDGFGNEIDETTIEIGIGDHHQEQQQQPPLLLETFTQCKTSSSSRTTTTTSTSSTPGVEGKGVWKSFHTLMRGNSMRGRTAAGATTAGTTRSISSSSMTNVDKKLNNLLSINSLSLGSIQEEGSDEDEDEDPIMEVMDYLEDEIDEHTYDDLIPLQIRMALEDQVFGWDHFFSNILGHVSFTVGSYLLTFWLITFVVLHQVPWGHYDSAMGAEGVEGGGGMEGEDTTTAGIVRTNNPWGMPHELFSFIRTALSIGSAISTFRTIRRRRRVWLRHPYGSAEYLAAGTSREEEDRRQSSLEEADRRARRFVLGSKLWAKMQRSYMKRRTRYLTRGVNRKLLKAEKMFERRHRNRVKLIRSTSASSLIDQQQNYYASSGGSSGGKRRKQKQRAVASALTRHGHESSHHERVRMLAATPGTARIRVDSSEEYDNDDDTASMGGSSVRSGATGEDQSLLSDYQHHHHNFGILTRMDSHTLPNFAMESVSHDQMPFAHGEIKRIPYVHGGFFGAAPFMLTNPHWIAILRILMPDVYVEISRRASYAPAPRLIHWAENNPVVAAYGTAHEIEFSGRVSTLEWDVFLDPHLVRRVEIVLSEKEAFLQRQKEARKNSREDKTSDDKCDAKTGPGGDGDGEGDNKANGESAPPSNSSTPINAADERLVLSYYDKEIKRRTTILVERMLIAHGNVAQLVLEQTGYFKKYNFSRVKRTRKTLGGGIFARQWLAVYSEAMKLGMGYDDGIDDEVSDSGTDGSLEEREDYDFYKDEDGGVDRNNDLFTSPRSASVAHSHDGGTFQTPSHEERRGPPRKIVMMRSDESDDGMSTDGDGSINSSRSERPTPRKTSTGKKRRIGKRSPAQPLEKVEATSLHKASVCPDKTIAESIALLKPIMQCSAPFGLVMDMKSRHVSRQVWALVVDFLRDCGARVEGVASFIVEEVRDITQYCSSSVNEIVFIHSAGDLQHGCHNGQIRRGDRVFFNAGSLLWDYPNLYDAEVLRNILWHRFQPCFDEQGIKEGYRLKPYAKITRPSSRGSSPRNQIFSESESETCDESTLDEDGDSVTSDLFARLLIADRKKKSLSEMDFVYEEDSSPDGNICSTIQQYKDYYQLSIGLYVQEFAIDEVAIGLIVKYVNSNLHVYDLGLSWGGINGLTVKGIQPGRFTATDGLWNQRYGGMPWKKELKPSSVISRD